MSGLKVRAMTLMKRFIAGLAVGIISLPCLSQAETVISVSQVNYNYRNEPLCTVVRMNPTTFGALPSDPCSQATLGSNGPDRITQNVYDAAGQLLAVYQGVGTSDIRQYAYYNYTSNGLKAFEIDANHNKTTFTYDGFDRLSKVQYPNTIAGNEISSTTDYETFGYDANSNRTNWRHRNAQTVIYTYDNLNREILKDLPAYAGSTATSKDIYTGYDALGHIQYKRFTSTVGAGITYYYDGLGRASATTDMNGRSTWYGYNADSTRNVMLYSDTTAQYYTYNNDGTLNWAGIAGGAVAYQPWYDSLGRVTAIGRSNNANTYYGYDGVGRPTSMLHDFADTGYDVTWSFNGYNPANQITSWNASSTVYDYVETATTTTAKTYDGLNRDATIAAVTGGYDSAGNMANDGARIFTYDVENRLLTEAATGVSLNLEYDPEGRLYRYSYNGNLTSFAYDGTNLIGEYDGSGNMLKRYMHTLGTDQPWVQFTGSAVGTANATYLYANYQGSIIATADMSGTVTDLYKYGPYGEPRNYGNAESWSGNRFRYTGQIVIPEAQLYYYKARVYDPNAGRFLQTDPVGSDDDLDLYAYVGGDPINATDPTGMMSFAMSWLESKLELEQKDDDQPVEITVIKHGTGPFGCDRADMGCQQARFHDLSAQNDRKNWWVVLPVIAPYALYLLPESALLGEGTAASRLCCFAAGTLVSAQYGLVPIEKIEIGDLVLSRDETTGQTALKPVTNRANRHDREIYQLTVSKKGPSGSTLDEVFSVTEDHPWRTSNGKWTETEDLQPGQEIVTENGPVSVVVDIQNTRKFRTTYNLEVADFHTYFVGKQKLLVHNGICGELSKQARRLLKNQAFRRWFHKVYKGKQGFGGGGKKNPNMTDEEVIDAYQEWMDSGQPKV